MIVFEHRLESFDTMGSDCYIDGFAERLDRLIVGGWKVLEMFEEARPENIASRL